MPIDQASTASSAADLIRESIRSCEDEPIRIPGSIQQHGFLLLLDSSAQNILAASGNTPDFLGIPLPLILGTPVENLLDREVLQALRSLTESSQKSGAQVYLGSFPVRGKLYSAVTHSVGDERIIEFESIDRLVSTEMANQVFTNFVSRLSVLRTEQELCDALAEQIKILTGFNRVMLYRFDEVGHGTVLSEHNDGAFPSYLDLRFPASDIPKQARDLYVLNTVRIIPDAAYTPSPLHALGNRRIASLDLSMSILRSVSPIHVEYMRNMGTLSSMSVSLIIDGKLWGLVSGHHASPHMVPYIVRSACDLLAKLVCTQLMNLRASASLKTLMHFHSVQRRMLTQMAADKNYLATISSQMDDVVQITGASGAALVIDGKPTLFGNTPGPDDISRLVDWLDSQPDLELFHSRSLSQDLPWAQNFASVASGLLVIRISHVNRSYLMWFRPEVILTVQWAGPPKASGTGPHRLNPRTSFEHWKELVRGQSEPWSEIEIESATDFRAAITTITLKRAEEALQLGEARFLQLTHALPNPVFTVGDDGQLSYVNQKWLDQGLTAEGCWYEQQAIPKEDQLRCAAAWTAAVAESNPIELEIRLRPSLEDRPTPENLVRWNLVHVVPYRRADQSLGGWIGNFTDLTDRRQRETALRMSEKLALTGRMTSVIAHEINNPLESLTNLLYLLRNHVADDSAARNYISIAESELERISGITKQTLRWSKERAQAAQYGTAGELFEDVLRLFAGQIRNRGVTVTVEGGGEVRFFAAIGQLSQVIANLISNAIQAVPVGGRIWLNATPGTDTMTITIRDAGSGMSEETLRNLFQPFFSTKGDLGNGLGLYISHEIVERNRGRLIITSKLGHGTEVQIHLPTHPQQ